VAVLTLAGASGAEELVGEVREQPIALSTTPATQAGSVEPVAVTTVPVSGASVAVTTVTPNSTQVAVPVAVPVAVTQNPDLVAWKELDGKVQSVDRNNHTLTVQDNEGKDVRVAMNNRIRVFRRGQEIGYSDIAPNDSVTLRYVGDHPAKSE